MAVSFSNSLGTWQVDGRGHYPTKEAAEAADSANAQNTNVLYDEDEFVGAVNRPNRVLGATSAGGTSSARAGELQADFEASDALYQAGVRDLDGDGKVTARDKELAGLSYGTPTSQGGSAKGYQVTKPVLGTGISKPVNGHPTVELAKVKGLPGEGADGFHSVYSYTTTPGGGGTTVNGHIGSTGPASPYGATPNQADVKLRDFEARERTDEAEVDFKDTHQENAAENDNLFADAMDRYNKVTGGEYGLSDEARAYQQEGLQQQRVLLEKLLGFDEDQYAAQFADQAMARTIAAGRQGTSAAAQQAGMFAAMEQAPALYAEGRQQASAQANQRLGMAQQVTKTFGELGTMTRGQDETRAQFEAQLPLEIADSVAALTQGKMTLNQQESAMFAEVWMEFAQLQSIYAGMSSDEQMAWWNDQTARRGQDKTFEAIKAQLKAQGAISDKDMLNALFQLGGGLLTLGGKTR